MKPIYLSILILLLTACASTPEPTELITTIGDETTTLKVTVKSIKFTDLYPSDPCITSGDCIPWGHWYRYKAKVTGVIQGEYSHKDISFVVLQSHYVAVKGTKNWYIRLGALTNPETRAKLETDYFVIEFGSSVEEIEEKIKRKQAYEYNWKPGIGFETQE